MLAAPVGDLSDGLKCNRFQLTDCPVTQVAVASFPPA